jgi:outer membrane protein assembly factor BamD (BamD/ComL family)
MVGTALAVCGVTPAVGAQRSSELARQHLESGIQFYNQQRYQQALNDFQIIVTSMADTDYADDALLHIGQYHLEIEGDFDKARESFEQVLQRYPTGDKAPGAYYYLGLVALRSDRGGEGLDDAMANFQRVIRLYPNSAYVAAALTATGTALERSARWEEAVDVYSQVASEYASSSSAPSAQIAIGRCSVRLGDPFQGMVELQRARNLYPDSVEAGEALDLLTLLFRFYAYPRLGRTISFTVDSGFRLAQAEKFKDVMAVRLSSTGIHVLERGRKRILTFDPAGKLTGTRGAAAPHTLSVDPFGALVVANEKAIMIGQTPKVFTVPEEKGPKPLEKIKAAARDRHGDIYIYDESQRNVIRFDPAGKLKGPFPDSTHREVLRMEVDRAGNLVMLNKKDRRVEIFSPEGRRMARIDKRGGKWDLKKPVDVAIDPAGYLYLLDEDRAQIAVFDPSYEFVALLSAQNLGGGSLNKPTTLDVDSSGALYVYDDKAKALTRLH